MSGSQNGTPQFDFSELSWGDEKSWSRMFLMLRKAGEENDAELMSEAHVMLDAYLAKVVTHVPREWLVKSAPDKLDWSVAASLEFVRGDKILTLRDEMIKAKQGN